MKFDPHLIRRHSNTTKASHLRRMRESVFAEGRSLSSVEAQVELAREFPIDVEQFRANLASDEAAEILRKAR